MSLVDVGYSGEELVAFSGPCQLQKASSSRKPSQTTAKVLTVFLRAPLSHELHFVSCRPISCTSALHKAAWSLRRWALFTSLLPYLLLLCGASQHPAWPLPLKVLTLTLREFTPASTLFFRLTLLSLLGSKATAA